MTRMVSAGKMFGMSYLPFSGTTRIVYESNESDTDESIPEIDINLKLNVQPYQYEPVKRQELSQNTRDDESDSEISHDSNEPTDVSDEDLPSDMHWYVF